MSTYNQNNGTFDPYSHGANGYTDTQSTGTLLTKVFFLMFVSLLATGATSYVVGSLLERSIELGNETTYMVLLALIVASAIGLFVLSIVIPRKAYNGFSSLIPDYIAYLVFMAMLLTIVFIAYDLSVLSLSFGITAGVFGIMALLGYLSKGSLVGIGPLVGGLFIGSIALSLLNWFIGSELIAWVISFAFFALILFITMYDVRRVKNIIDNGEINGTTNLVLYCSLILYTDFINIFLRIVRYVAIFARKK